MSKSRRNVPAPLAALPVALDLRTVQGDIVFSTAESTGPEARQREDGKVLLTERFTLPVGAETYELSVVVDATEQARLGEELYARAFFDELTGLPNRVKIERTVEALIAADAAPFALAFIDLDGFKSVNDCLGHDVGDALLARIAERLSANLRATDMLARLGGDEFLLLINPLDDPAGFMAKLAQFGDKLKEPFFIHGHEILTSGSIGVSVFPRDGRSYSALRTNADRAMYSCKASVKGAVRLFDQSISQALSERHRLEQRLRRAVLEGRICCAYQPKLDFRNQTVTGVEVLMRWIDEEGLVQGPGAFLQAASELGLMEEITHSILAETVATIDQINEAFGRSCSLSLNVAAKQAGDFEFMRSLVNALDRTGFADRFMLELTEEAFLAQSRFQGHILPLIRSVGARVSIDDFGVGYSSLSTLAAITADEIKVDRSFITDVHRRPRSQSILRAVEALGGSLGMTIVVEGVETADELAYLQSATGINHGQGYCFSRPILLTRAGRDTAAALDRDPAARMGRSLARAGAAPSVGGTRHSGAAARSMRGARRG